MTNDLRDWTETHTKLYSNSKQPRHELL